MIFVKFVSDKVYFLNIAVVSVFTITAALQIGALTASERLHNIALNQLLKNPMLFFDITPVGRILSRFSNDVNVIDSSLPINLRQTVFSFFRVCLIITLSLI